MTRNFFRRVEALFPVYVPELRDRILKDLLPAELRDNVDARVLQPDGTYVLPVRKEGEAAFAAQKYFMESARKRAAEQIEVVS
jgi:polyphosphate kinase